MKTLIFILFSLISLQICAQTDTTKILKRGIYLSHKDYVNNTPSIRDSFTIKSHERLQNAWRGSIAFTPKYYDTNTKVDDAWGFCDGHKQYIYFQDSFFELVKNNDTIGFDGYAVANVEKENANVTTGYIIGGLTGLLIAEVINNSNKVKYKIPYILDPNSGAISCRNPAPILPHPRTISKLYIYRTKIKEKDEPVKFSVNDSLFYDFIPFSFIEMEFTVSDLETKICYGTDYSECIYVKHNNSIPRYVKVVSNKKTGEEYLEIVKETQGKNESFAAENQQRKREKKEALMNDSRD